MPPEFLETILSETLQGELPRSSRTEDQNSSS